MLKSSADLRVRDEYSSLSQILSALVVDAESASNMLLLPADCAPQKYAASNPLRRRPGADLRRVRKATWFMAWRPAMSYYLFARLPHMPPTWTLAVLSTSVADARRHVRATWRGGSLVATVASGKIAADCGAITDAAAEETHRRMEEYHAETMRMIEAGELAALLC